MLTGRYCEEMRRGNAAAIIRGLCYLRLGRVLYLTPFPAQRSLRLYDKDVRARCHETVLERIPGPGSLHST